MYSSVETVPIVNALAEKFSIRRNEIVIGTARGFYEYKRNPCMIRLIENVDVQVNDLIVDQRTDQQYLVEDVSAIIQYGKTVGLYIRYKAKQ